MIFNNQYQHFCITSWCIFYEFVIHEHFVYEFQAVKYRFLAIYHLCMSRVYQCCNYCLLFIVNNHFIVIGAAGLMARPRSVCCSGQRVSALGDSVVQQWTPRRWACVVIVQSHWPVAIFESWRQSECGYIPGCAKEGSSSSMLLPPAANIDCEACKWARRVILT